MKNILLNLTILTFLIISSFSCEKEVTPTTNKKEVKKATKNSFRNSVININEFTFEVGQTYEFFVNHIDVVGEALKMTCTLDANGTLTINREIISYANSSELPQSLIKTETSLTETTEGYEADYINEDDVLLIPFSPSDNGIYGKDTGPINKYSCSCPGLVAGTGGGSCYASAQSDGSMGCNSEGCAKCKLKITKVTIYQTYSGMLIIDDGINSGIANIVLN